MSDTIILIMTILLSLYMIIPLADHFIIGTFSKMPFFFDKEKFWYWMMLNLFLGVPYYLLLLLGASLYWYVIMFAFIMLFPSICDHFSEDKMLTKPSDYGFHAFHIIVFVILMVNILKD